MDKIILQAIDGLGSLHEHLKTFENVLLVEQLNQLAIAENEGKALLKRLIEDSYSQTFMNIDNVIKAKKSYLTALTL